VSGTLEAVMWFGSHAHARERSSMQQPSSVLAHVLLDVAHPLRPVVWCIAQICDTHMTGTRV
jgi:hypothetical protein